MRRTLPFLAFSWLVALAVDAQEAPHRPKLLTKETFMDMQSVFNPSISPDGTKVLFARGWIDQLKDEHRSNLWMVDLGGGRVSELTQGKWKDSSPAWSPDGARVAFLSDRDGSEQIHVLWLDTREIAQLTHLERAPENLRWSPDGRRIAFTLFVPEKKPPLEVKLPDGPAGAQRAKSPVVIDRLSWAADGKGPLPPGQTHVFTIDAALGGPPRQVTSGPYTHGRPEWSADGKTIYTSAIRKPNPEYQHGDTEIYAVDLGTLEVRALTDRKGPDFDPLVSPDGRWIAYAGHDERGYTYHLNHLYLMDKDGGQKRVWVEKLQNSPTNISWTADSAGVCYTVAEQGQTSVYFAPLEGAPRRIGNGASVLGGLTIARNGLIATVRSSIRQPGQLVTFSLSEPENVRTLVDVNADRLSGISLAAAEEVSYPSQDGLRIQGWLMKPAEFDPGKKYPLVLWIHGGPWSSYDVGWSWSFQNFAALGYGVLWTNPRGSTGYGQEFVNGIQNSYPGKDFDDLMGAVDAAISKGWIDEKNLFVCGASGGGVLTAWTVGHTDRFAAAVSMKPVIDWGSFVGTTDGSSWYGQFRKYPWEDPVEYADRSPLRYVARVKTPTMLLTGEADLRTPIGQTEEFYRALKMLRKETLLVRVPEEYHGFRRPSHQLLQQLYLVAWFEKYRRR